MFPMYHSPIRCIRSGTSRISFPAWRWLLSPTTTLLLLKKHPRNNRHEAKNHAYKDRSTYRQGTSSSACLLSGHHLPRHGVRNVSLLLSTRDNVAHKAAGLEWNADSTLLYRYCSGQIAMDPETKTIVEGGISDRTASHSIYEATTIWKKPCCRSSS